MDYYKLATWFWTSYKAELLTIAWTQGHAVFAPWIPTVYGVFNAPTVANYACPPCEPWNEKLWKVSFLLDKEKFLLDPTAPPRIRHLGDCPFLLFSHSGIPASLTSLSPSQSTCSESLWWAIDFRVWYREQDKSLSVPPSWAWSASSISRFLFILSWLTWGELGCSLFLFPCFLFLSHFVVRNVLCHCEENTSLNTSQPFYTLKRV